MNREDDQSKPKGEPLNELALFAGAGGGILGGHLLGWRTICAVEWETYPASVLISRQNDGVLPPFPIWDDVQTFDGRPWRGRVDVVSGGFPCQDISCAGKGAGIDGERSSMWSHMARIIGEVRPRYVFVENSPMLVGRGLARVLGDLAKMGYDAEWCVLGAHHVAAPHKRDRIWLAATSDPNSNRQPVKPVNDETSIMPELGNAHHDGQPTPEVCGSPSQRGDRRPTRQEQTVKPERSGEQHGQLADTTVRRCQEQREEPETAGDSGQQGSKISDSHSKRLQKLNTTSKSSQARQSSGALIEEWRSSWWAVEPDVGRVAHGLAARVDRLKAIGNGQVPAVAKLAWETLTKTEQ